SAWIIEIKYKDGISNSAKSIDGATISNVKRRLAQIEFKKTGDVAREVRTWTDGTKIESWFSQGFHVRESLFYEGQIDIVGRAKEGKPSMIFPGYSELKWITEEDFSGEETYQGKKCYKYKKKSAPQESKKSPLTKSPLQGMMISEGTVAYIDTKTRKPVAILFQDQSWTFSYIKAPSQTLSLPDVFLQALRKYARGFNG
ncbi:MAG: hypothetical protein AAF558_05410, partial [Verrucomicrobiota bacterium]